MRVQRRLEEGDVKWVVLFGGWRLDVSGWHNDFIPERQTHLAGMDAEVLDLVQRDCLIPEWNP